jgi:hypothetical protein
MEVWMNFRHFFEGCGKMMLLSDIEVSEALRYHLERSVPLHDNVFRAYSPAYMALVEEVRSLYDRDLIALTDEDADLVESDLGRTAIYEGRVVRLDAPFPVRSRLDEAEHKGKKVKIGKPFRTPGEGKKFAVYVKSKSGRVKKVRFGDPNLTVKNDNPARAKSFRARHKCSEKKDRTKAGYWACRIGRYAKSVGLKSNKSW